MGRSANVVCMRRSCLKPAKVRSFVFLCKFIKGQEVEAVKHGTAILFGEFNSICFHCVGVMVQSKMSDLLFLWVWYGLLFTQGHFWSPP